MLAGQSEAGFRALTPMTRGETAALLYAALFQTPVPLTELPDVETWDAVLRSRRPDRPGVRRLLRYAASDVIPSGIETTVTRNYGETAKDKSDELLKHMLIAALSVPIASCRSRVRNADCATTISAPRTAIRRGREATATRTLTVRAAPAVRPSRVRLRTAARAPRTGPRS